jgi:hypothetical protein
MHFMAAAAGRQGMVPPVSNPSFAAAAAAAAAAGTRQHAEYLWRITKDENQRSFIAKEEIVE